LGARPAQRFRLHEFPDAIFLDVIKVLQHAHPVPGPVSFVQMFQGSAGHLFALITILEFPFAQDLTGPDLAS
jgi:hypothetical protein